MSEAWHCLICARPVSRLYGLNAAVRTPEGEVEEKISVAGYCAKHRDEVLPAFVEQMGRAGEVIAFSDDPQPLRPDQAEKWMAFSAEFTSSTPLDD